MNAVALAVSPDHFIGGERVASKEHFEDISPIDGAVIAEISRAAVTLDSLSTDGSLHTAPPIVNVRHFPRLAAGRHDEPQVHELVRSLSRDRSASTVYAGEATLNIHAARGEEHHILAPVELGRGYRFTFAYTVDDLETVKELT